MTDTSFERFYYTVDGKKHDISEVQEEYERKRGNISKFYGKMKCPECEQADLSFTHKTERREFLSKLPSSSHKEGCSYIHPKVSKKIIIQHINSLTDLQIHNRLETALNLLQPHTISSADIPKGTDKRDNPFVVKIKKDKDTYKYFSMPKKSLNTFLGKDIEFIPHIFYGTVKLKVSDMKSTVAGCEHLTYHYLNIYTKKRDGKWIRKTSIFRGTFLDIIEEDKEYDIAILGWLTFKYTNEKNKSPQIEIPNKACILLR